MKTARELILEHLSASGYDGLYLAGECACLVDDLAPCESMNLDGCTAGYRVDCTDPRCEVCEGGYAGWHVQAEMPSSR